MPKYVIHLTHTTPSEQEAFVIFEISLHTIIVNTKVKQSYPIERFAFIRRYIDFDFLCCPSMSTDSVPSLEGRLIFL
jgi:hypothetical protein